MFVNILCEFIMCLFYLSIDFCIQSLY